MCLLGSDIQTSSQVELSMEAQTRIILRGKRTKRSRPSTVVTSSSSTSAAETGLDSDAFFEIPSPTPRSLSFHQNSASTEEDEDMANCLMLLARSGGSFGQKQHHNDEISTNKFTRSSRKFNEMAASSTSGKQEFYGYECKTCNRGFTSFQALGGHRASHKKPKSLIEEKSVPMSTILNDNDQQHIHFNKTSPSIGQQKAKVHECSICGSEFSSGQALGGHMRRHRIPTTNTSSTISSITHHEHQRPRNHVLQLDLNLPAPEDDHYDSKFQFVISTPALVDCHY